MSGSSSPIRARANRGSPTRSRTSFCGSSKPLGPKADAANRLDAIFQRIKREGIAFGSGPRSPDDMALNRRGGGRGFYFKDPNGYVLEVLTE